MPVFRYTIMQTLCGPWPKSWEQIQRSVKSIEKQGDILYVVCEDETYILKFSIRDKRIEKIEYENYSLSVTDGSGQAVKVKTAKQYDICYVDVSVVADQLARHLDCVELEYALTTQYFELSEEHDQETEFLFTVKDATELTREELAQIEQQLFNSPESSNIGQRFLFSWYDTQRM